MKHNADSVRPRLTRVKWHVFSSGLIWCVQRHLSSCSPCHSVLQNHGNIHIYYVRIHVLFAGQRWEKYNLIPVVWQRPIYLGICNNRPPQVTDSISKVSKFDLPYYSNYIMRSLGSFKCWQDTGITTPKGIFNLLSIRQTPFCTKHFKINPIKKSLEAELNNLTSMRRIYMYM